MRHTTMTVGGCPTIVETTFDDGTTVHLRYRHGWVVVYNENEHRSIIAFEYTQPGGADGVMSFDEAVEVLRVAEAKHAAEKILEGEWIV
ncbi:hypothetical protein SEA_BRUTONGASTER_136 [Gordonia phage BrutonGaster]|uniref:Uncharacterized protein n=1 Tax=Gordonia phage BrutonGaster TaxID=2530116 RepID=A0A482JMQ2_9CAUD|nr:hypothetical protein HOV26_gp046 [Gordonia phage BrutonGaster]QBP33350.1 hypothetical protein SEA_BRUTONGASTER_136 [Gordonia phage BrutonGaster]